jgi:hypothetical protein
LNGLAEIGIMTNSEASVGWKRYRLLPAVMALTCVFIWGAIFASIAERNVGADKDWLFLYLCGIEFVQPQLHEQQIDLVRKVVAVSANDQTVYRATMRANYCNNYPFTSFSIYLAGKWQSYFGASAAENFPAFVVHSLWYGIVLSGALLGIFTILSVFALTTDPLRTTLFVAFGLAAIFYWAVPLPVTNWFLYQSTPAPPAKLVDWSNVLLLGLHSWLNPGDAYSPFSVFPRCLCALLAFAAFALRWSGRPAAAYWVPLLIGGIHQSTTAILLFVLICCDIAIRPQVLARAAILVPIGVNVAVVFLRERMFAILGFSTSDVLIAVAIMLGLVVALAMSGPVRAAVRAGLSRIAVLRSHTVEGVPVPFADALIIFSVWLVLILISYLAARSDAWYRVIYFWSELSPRYIGMFQLSLIAGLLFPVIAMMQSARPAAGKWFAASVAAVLVAVAVSQVMTQQMRSLASQIQWTQELDTKVAAQRDAYGGGKVPTIRDESAWYYLMLRNAILGDRSLATFFGKP